jgi:hypothetical protein
MRVILLALVLGCASAYGQDDAGMMAAQQAAQANQQAMQQMQQDMQNAQQASQQAIQDSQNAVQNSGPVIAVTAAPTFSIKAGEVQPGSMVRLASRTHYATIYYTTNGWSPTTRSRRYKGPITINTTTQLQAMAVAPNMVRSPINSATYKVNKTATPSQPLALASDGVLHAGTRLHLVTGSEVTSKTAQVGDNISVLLDQDVTLGDAIILPKGTPVEATITQADPASRGRIPGDVAFEVRGISAGGKQIPLKGGETLEGTGRPIGAYILIPVIGPIVGLSQISQYGDEAVIKPGMTMTAAVAVDTPLM